jgi:hypothetical protein
MTIDPLALAPRAERIAENLRLRLQQLINIAE